MQNQLLRISIGARMFCLVALLAAVAGVLPAPASASKVLVVQTARSGHLKAAGAPGFYSLVLRGVRPRVTTFDDGPGRRAGSLSARLLLKLLFPAKAADAHNASITAGGHTMAVRLRGGSYDAAAATLTYRVVRLEGSVTLPPRLKRPSLFIDDIATSAGLGGGLECAGWLQNNTPYPLYLENQWTYLWAANEFTNNPGAVVPPGEYTNWYDVEENGCQAAVRYGGGAVEFNISVLRTGGPTQYSCKLEGGSNTNPPTTCTYDEATTQASGMITYVLSGGSYPSGPGP